MHNQESGHRPRTTWLTDHTSCEFRSTDVWFQCISSPPEGANSPRDNSTRDSSSRDSSSAKEGGEEDVGRLEKNFFFYVEKVQYNREVAGVTVTAADFLASADKPTHCLTVTGS